MATIRLPNGETAQVPDDWTPEQIQTELTKPGAPTAAAFRTTGESVARVAGNFGGGFNRSALETVAALPELVSGGMRAVGLPAPERGFYTNKLQSGLDAVIGAPPKPEGGVEKFARGAGRGVADAMQIAMPAARVAQTAQGPLTRAVAQQLALAPVAQAAYGAIGGGVGEATDSPAWGVAASLAGPLAAGLARNSVTLGAKLNPEQQRLAEVLRNEKIPLTPAQQTGSKPLTIIDAVSENLPFTAGRAREINQGQRDAFTAAVMRRAGETTTSAAPDVIRSARERLGGEFNRLTSGRNVPLGDPQLNVLANVDAAQAELRGMVNTDRIDKLVNGTLDALAKGSISGEAAQRLRSELTKEAKDAAASQNNRLADALRKVRDTIDDAVGATMTGEDRKAWDTARRQYANLKIAERAMSGAGAEAASGAIPPRALRTAVAGSNRNDYAAGKGDLNELARAGEAFLRPYPTSGTGERLMWQGLLSGAPVASMAAGAEPVSTGAAALASLLLPKIAQTAIHSQAGTRALTNPDANANTARLMGQLLAARGKDSALAVR